MLMERMKEREKSLVIPVLAATYLDPEYQVLLTEEQRNSAKIKLQAFCL